MGSTVDVAVVGHVMVDVAVEAGALRRGGDVPGAVGVRSGGTAANAAAWAAAAGAKVRLYGRVGDDPAGRLVRDALAERGVDCALAVDPRAPTGSMLIVHERGERSMVSDPGANARLSPDDLPPRIDAGAVLVSGYLLFDPSSEPAGAAALERADSGLIAVEAASWPPLEAYGAERFLAATKRATLLLANDREASVLAAGGEGERAARMLADRYQTVCVKLGARGAVLVSGDNVHHAPARPAREVDPTGSGDAFDGVLLAALVRGGGIAEAAAEAAAAGARAAASREVWP